MEIENILLLDLLASHNQVEAVAVLSQTCTELYNRSDLSVKSLLKPYKISYDTTYTLKDCYIFYTLTNTFDRLYKYFKLCIKYDSDYLLPKAIWNLRRDIFRSIIHRDCHCYFDDPYVMRDEDMVYQTSYLIHEAYNQQSMKFLDTLIMQQYHDVNKINYLALQGLLRDYVERDDIEMVIYLLQPISRRDIFVDIYNSCESEEMFDLLYEFGIRLCKRDLKSMIRDSNAEILDHAIDFIDEELEEKLAFELLFSEGLEKEMFGLIDEEIGFVEYLRDNDIRFCLDHKINNRVENICKYGGREDKILILKEALIKDIRILIVGVLDLLFEFGGAWNYFRDRSEIKGKSSRMVCEELLDRMVKERNREV